MFSIRLHKEPAAYFSGEQIKGSVEIRTKERIKLKSISLTIKGYANVNW